MKKLIIMGALLTASAGFAQAPAAESGTTAAPASAPAAKDPEEMICRNVESTSTRLGRVKDCRTRAAWEELARRGRDTADRMRSGNN